MNTDEYVTAIHLALIDSLIVENYNVIRQRVTSQSGYLRVRVELANGDFLESAEFFRLTPDGIQVGDYRHQWMNGERHALRKRWDSTPHHPDLENAPHHCHDGSEETVIPGRPTSIRDVLSAITQEIDQAE